MRYGRARRRCQSVEVLRLGKRWTPAPCCPAAGPWTPPCPAAAQYRPAPVIITPYRYDYHQYLVGHYTHVEHGTRRICIWLIEHLDDLWGYPDIRPRSTGDDPCHRCSHSQDMAIVAYLKPIENRGFLVAASPCARAGYPHSDKKAPKVPRPSDSVAPINSRNSSVSPVRCLDECRAGPGSQQVAFDTYTLETGDGAAGSCHGSSTTGWMDRTEAINRTDLAS